MEKIERTNAPEWLTEKWQEWGEEWADKCKNKKNPSFTWRRYKNKGRKELEKELSTMTHHHCSFCDAYPMGRRLRSTIEHFRPKIRFPLLAYQWENLFLACGLCQEKGDQFDEKLLKPDEDDYAFERYFEIDWFTGELKPNRLSSSDDQERARMTIDMYRLNSNGKPEDRLEELYKYDKAHDIDAYSYRFFIKRGI